MEKQQGILAREASEEKEEQGRGRWGRGGEQEGVEEKGAA